MNVKIALMAGLLAGCSAIGNPVPDATCDALDQYLPTWSSADTRRNADIGSPVSGCLCGDL